MTDTYYITTPIYYVNDAPHIGHAYTTLACDVLARFKRLDGYDVKFLTGTDEHGQKVEKSAQAAGVDPQAFTDRVSQNFRDLADFMHYSHDDFIRTLTRRNEVVSFVKGGLQDLSVSRTTFKWGVPVPGDDDHIMYVWLDALTNYITAVGFPEAESGEYPHYWPADLHMVGKDILRFHAVYWPAFLMAADLEPPKRVFAHGWWTNEGQKISKSLGNVIDPFELVEKYGLDQVRYFLLREVPFGNDGDFSHQAMVNRMNGELANDYGNLAQRVLSMIAKNCDGCVPEAGDYTAEDTAMLDAGGGLLAEVRGKLDVQAFHEALEAIWAVIRAANAYVDAQAPWKLRKEDPARMATVLFVLAETIRRLAVLTQPYMPDASARLLDQLGVAANARDFARFDAALTAGAGLPKPEGAFPRYQEPEEAPAA
ncbi:MAG: methionine--tRNA ligase [Rhodospirillaceae bacterium]